MESPLSATLSPTPPSSPSASSRRRLIAPLAAVALAATMVGAALASTPVTNGYRDQSYGGGVFRPTSDKSQSKLWFTDNTWFAGLFLYQTTQPPKSENRIYRLNETTHSFVDTGVVLDDRDNSHGDLLWDEATQTLFIASSHPHSANVASNDSIRIYRYSYDSVTNVYTKAAAFPVQIPGTETTDLVVGGANTVTL